MSCIAAGALLVLVGCANLETITTFSDTRIGFLVSGATGNEAARRRYAAPLADKEFTRRQRPIVRTEPELVEYERLLAKPLQVGTEIEGSEDLAAVPDSQKRRLLDYYRNNRSRLMIEGATVSKAWAAELQKVSTALANVRKTRADLHAKADAHIKRGDRLQAAALYVQALQLAPENKDTEQRIRRNAGAWLVEIIRRIKADTAKGPLANAAKTQKTVFRTEKSTLEEVAGCRAAISASSDLTQSLRKYMPTDAAFVASTRNNIEALEQIEEMLGTMHGLCHTEQLRLLSGKSRYWAAYEYSADVVARMPAMAPNLARPQKKALVTSYGAIVPRSAAYYVGQANDRYAEDAYGLALVFCRMGQQVAALGGTLGIAPSKELKTWQSRTSESIRDCQARLKERMSRKIIIPNVTPALADLNDLAALVHDSCARMCSGRPADGKPRVWAVRTEREQPQSQPMDYLVQLSLPHFSITALPAEETARELVSVGLGVRRVPNPISTVDPDVPTVIYEQDVLLYQRTGRRHTKEVHIEVEATMAHRRKLLKLVELSERLPNDKLKIPGIVVRGVETYLDTPFMGPPRTSTSAMMLTEDPLPRATAAHLSSDLQIRSAMLSHASGLVVDEIMRVVSAYPLRVLVPNAVQQQGAAVQSANAYGRCLEYCSQLALAADAAGRRPAPAWPVLKGRMQDRINEMNAGIWKDEPAPRRKILADIWNISVASALKTIDR